MADSTPQRMPSAAAQPGRFVGVWVCIFFAMMGQVSLAQDLPPQNEPSPLEIERQELNHRLFRDRRQAVLIGRIDDAFAAGDVARGRGYLQDVFSAESDSYSWQDASPQLTSAQHRARAVFESLPLSAIRRYERAYEPRARAILNAAPDGAEGLKSIQKLVRSYYYTSAGFEAAERLAASALDQGEFSQAARIWNRLLASPPHSARIRPSDRVQAALANKLAGNESVFREISRGLSEQAVIIAGRQQSASDFFEQFTPPKGGSAANTGNWTTAWGSSHGPLAMDASPPDQLPAWSNPLWPTERLDLAELLKNWQSRRDIDGSPPAVVGSPIAIDGSLIYRDPFAIRSVEVRTGRQNWQYNCQQTIDVALDRIPSGGDVRQRRTTLPADVGFEEAFACNTVQGTVTASLRMIFAVDGLPPAPGRRRRGDRFRQDSPETDAACNYLVALPIRTSNGNESVQPTWRAGGPKGNTTAASLAGHYFFGPPLPLGNVVYAISEHDLQISLSAIEADTGHLIWTPGLGLVENAVNDDARRYVSACTPSYADGVLVCPTGIGILAGVDLSDGSLLWADFIPSDETRADSSFSSFTQPAFIQDGRVFYHPESSDTLHALSLSDGTRLWERSIADCEYIAAVGDGLVLVIGPRTAVGLDINTGQTVWRTRVGLPSGRGLQVGDRYMLPLADGGVLPINMTTGEVNNSPFVRGISLSSAVTSQRSTSGEPTGNLLAHDGMMISFSARSISAFRQAADRLEEVQRALAAQPFSAELELQAAELELIVGETSSARNRLDQLVRSDANPAVTPSARRLLRELLYASLNDDDEVDLQAVLAEVGELADTPAEQARYLMHRAEAAFASRDFSELLTTANELRRSASEIHPSGNESHVVDVTSWIRRLIGRVQSEFPQDMQAAIRSEVAHHQQAALQSDAPEAWTQFLADFDEWPEASAVRLRLAVHELAHKHPQRSELLLLQDRHSSDESIAAQVDFNLLRLWDQAGLHYEAASVLQDLESRFADISVADGQTGAEIVANFSRDSLTWAAFERIQPPARPIRRVTFKYDQWADRDNRLREIYEDYRRRFPTPSWSTFHLIDHGKKRPGELSIVDKNAGRIVSSVDITTRTSSPLNTSQPHIGHFFPLGGPGAANGISLLEHFDHRPFWTVTPDGPSETADVFRVGPAGPEFAAFQARSQLVVIDPATGRIRWRRNHLDSKSGLITNPSAGLIGDEHVLVLFASDHTSYTVYETATGRELRNGKLDSIEISQPRRAFGRHLFFVSYADDGPRARLWDPLENRLLLDVLTTERVVTASTPDEEIAILTADSQVLLVNAFDGQIRNRIALDIAADDLREIKAIRVFSSRTHDFINLQRPRDFGDAAESTFVNDTMLPVISIDGELIAASRIDGHPQWSRQMEPRSVVQLSELQLPILVMLARARNPHYHEHQSLVIEVLDTETGSTLGLQDDIRRDRSDRLVHYSYWPEQGTLELHWLNGQLSIDLDRQKRALPTDSVISQLGRLLHPAVGR